MGNVISLAAARSQRELLVLPTPDQLSDRIDSVAHQYLSPGAFLLLRQIFRFSKEGRGELSYKFLCSELRITNKSLTKYIDELELHCLVKVRRSRISKINATNQFEIDFKGPLGASMTSLKTPRHQRLGGTGKFPVRGRGVQEKVKSNSNTNTSSKEQLITNVIRRDPAPQFDSVSEAVEHTQKRTVRKREEKVAKAITAGSQLTLAGVKATWSAVMLKHYPKVPPVLFTKVEFMVFKMRMRPILTTSNMSMFFDYVVSSWSHLRETKFKWLRAKGKDVAPSPSLPELMRYWKIFAQAFSDSIMVDVTNQDKLKRTELGELKDKLATQAAETARAKAEASKLREKLARVERMLPTTVAAEKPVLSLSARRKLADEKYNAGSDEIPDWK